MSNRQKFSYDADGAVPAAPAAHSDPDDVSVDRLFSVPKGSAPAPAERERAAAPVRGDLPEPRGAYPQGGGQRAYLEVEPDDGEYDDEEAYEEDFEPAPARGRKARKEKKDKGAKRRHPVLVTVITVLVLAVITVGAFGFFHIVDVAGIAASYGIGREPANDYTVADREQFLFYLTHPAIKSGDTIRLSSPVEIDVDSTYGGFVSLPLIQFAGERLTFTGGTVLFSGDSDTDFSNVTFNATTVYIEAPQADITAQGLDDSHVSAKTLNGSAHVQSLDLLFPGSRMNVLVVFTNLTGRALTNVQVHLTSASFIFVDGDSYILDELPANGTVAAEIPVVATEGGRLRITAWAVEGGEVVVTGGSDYVSVFGPGWYAGDIHTHTSVSRSERYGSLANNITNAYDLGLSYIVSVENELAAEKLAQSDVDKLTGEPGAFEQYTGYELGPTNRHLLIYDYDKQAAEYGYPSTNWDQLDSNTGIRWNFQMAVEEVVNNGGIAVLPHFFDYEDINVSIDMAKSLRYESAFEILTLQHIYSPIFDEMDSETRCAFNIWNARNVMGEKIFATFASDNMSSSEVGTRYIKGYMPMLSEQNLYANLRTGNYYCSTGPELRFDISGVQQGSAEMVTWGGSLTEENRTDPLSRDDATGTATAHVYASADSPLVSVKIYRYYIVATNLEKYGGIVYEEDLTGQNVYSYSKDIELTLGEWTMAEGEYTGQQYEYWRDRMNKGEFYRIEVSSEDSLTAYEGDYGVALSNPIWTEMDSTSKENNYADITSIENVLGAEVKRAPNGTLYMKAEGVIPTLLHVGGGLEASIVYHRLGSETMADYVLIDVYTGRRHTTTKIYLV